MIFPITDLLSEAESVKWLEQHFHPRGFGCARCGAAVAQSSVFRLSQRGLLDYRCQACSRVYNLYSGTLLAGSKLRPAQTVLLLRGVCKGESSRTLAEELGVTRMTVHHWRHKLQAHAYASLDQAPLSDAETETDEMYQNAGEKR